MSNLIKDINKMHKKFGVHKWVKKQAKEERYDLLRKFILFRLNFLTEELDETRRAFQTKNSEELVDGIIDLLVVGIGTLDALGVDIEKAWKEVHSANMSKEPGIKNGRPNPLGLPDLKKPTGWTAPDHKGNVGLIGKTFRPNDDCKCHTCYMRRGY